MKFSIKEWRRIYDTVHELGRTLRDSRVTYDDLDRAIAPKINLSPEVQSSIESNIKSLTQRSSKYLDQCGMRPNKPLWHYDRKDCKTWRSHESFKFSHLLPEGL